MPSDYSDAIQNPHLTFVDAELRLGQPEVDKCLGLPKPSAGNFAVVYKITTPSSSWAVKCFTSEIRDQQERYLAISKHLADVKFQYAVAFTYMQTGIKVLGKNYPLLKMQWVQGESLAAFVARSIGYQDTLLSLAKVWVQMLTDLKAAQIAHGDLQHGNIVVVGDQLRLIDYDGMFVPALAGKQSNECGHRNYQLPSRTGWDFGLYLDNFSGWVVYVSLIALAVHPELWSKYGGGDECLIFRKEDFVEPGNSKILRDLISSSNSELRVLVELFTSLFNLTPRDVPSLVGNETSIIITPPPKDWWNDHVKDRSQLEEEQHVELGRSAGTATSTSDPSWILDSLTENNVIKPLSFQGQINEVRFFILSSMALIFFTRFLAEMPVSEFVIATLCVFGLNLLFCYIRFKRDPSQSEFQIFKTESNAVVRKVRENQAVMDAITAERFTVQLKLTEFEREIEVQKNSLYAELQAALSSAQIELNSHLRTINQRRKETASSETNKLNSIQGTLGNQITNLQGRISGLNIGEADEKRRTLATIQDMHVQIYLRSRYIRSSSIPGIGEAYKARLSYSGFVTAADINSSVMRVAGIGQTRGSTLLIWRQSLEGMARTSAPGLSTSDKYAIEIKYREERQTLQAEMQRIQTQLDAQIASARQFFGDLRQGIDDEDGQLRSVNEQKKMQLQQEHDVKISRLDARIADARNQAAPTLIELSQKLQTAQKQVFALKFQAAKKEKEGRRFASLHFGKYLRSIIPS